MTEFEGRYNDRPLDTIDQTLHRQEDDGKRLKYSTLTQATNRPAMAE